MKIAFIIPYLDITAYGVRMLSSCIVQAGHERRLIFLPFGEEKGNYTYPESLYKEILPLVKGYDIIGFSLMTNHFTRMAGLANYLRKELDAYFIWGGVHPTIAPESCFPYCDAVSIGEAEHNLVEFLGKLENKEDLTQVPGFFVKKGNDFIQTPPPTLIDDLDSLPEPDYTLSDDWAMIEDMTDGFERLTEDNIKKYFDMIYVSKIKPGTAYQTMTSRGCPYDCTYCCNQAFKNQVYNGKYHFRSRDTGLVIKEIRRMMDRFPWIEFVGISDDAFFMNTNEKMKEFADAWKKDIGLKFFCLGSPITINEKKLEYLTDAGLIALQVGVQTGSASINKLYNRERIKREKIIETAIVLNKFKDKLLPTYDIIINNPWETLQDKLDTLSLFRELARPFRPNIFSLVLFPGTALDIKARNDPNIPKDFFEFYKTGYEHRPLDYINFLWALHTRFLPPAFLSFISSYPIAWFYTRPVIRDIFAGFFYLGRRAFGIN